jgi:uncharacterized protein YfdQ (DUF2303 family)
MAQVEEQKNASSIAAAIVAGTMIADTRELIPEELVAVLVPNGARLEQIDLRAFDQKYANHPLRKTGRQDLATAAAFIAYVQAHADESSSIYANKAGTAFGAVFNDHQRNPPARPAAEGDAPRGLLDGMPGHRDFLANYACPLSVEWKRWMAKSQHEKERKEGMAQVDFMRFLEDNLQDITSPAGAVLLTAARNFEAHSDAKFKSATNLDNGSVVFNYTENVNEVAQEGKISLPTAFEITIPVFDGGDPYVIEARLRYRVGQGGMVLWYELVKTHKILEHAFNKVRDQIIAALPAVPVYDV